MNTTTLIFCVSVLAALAATPAGADVTHPDAAVRKAGKPLRVRDPFIVVDGGRYLLVSSTGEAVGPETDSFGENRDVVTVRESADMVNWSAPTTVLKLPKDFDSAALWAPEMHRYRGDWYLVVTVNYRDRKAGRGERGTWVFRSKSPKGPFVPHSRGSITPESWCALDGTLYIEDGHPYMVFCHEWIQVDPGTICAVRMTDDLAAAVGEPFVLFDAALGEKGSNVTDGPWLFKDKSGALQMLWSSGIRARKWRYGVLQSTSKNGRLAGQWSDTKVVLDNDEGHGMLFTDLQGHLRFAFHGPNTLPNERLKILSCEITDRGLRLLKERSGGPKHVTPPKNF